jgi:hypothetical protein
MMYEEKREKDGRQTFGLSLTANAVGDPKTGRTDRCPGGAFNV